MRHQPYETDLTDEQFALIEPFLPKAKATGRPHANFRDVLDAVFYVVRTGCQWRLLPHEFPPWSTVHETTSDYGAWTAPGRRSTRSCAKGSAYAQVAIPNRAPGSWIPNP